MCERLNKIIEELDAIADDISNDITYPHPHKTRALNYLWAAQERLRDAKEEVL